ncbi:hypothetical protein [Aliivibrio finisterrensis]|nr:hypothetical protein [Aliivibrio finisterrensis]
MLVANMFKALLQFGVGDAVLFIALTGSFAIWAGLFSVFVAYVAVGRI